MIPLLVAIIISSSCGDKINNCINTCTGNDSSVTCAEATLKYDKIMAGGRVRHASETWCDYVGCIRAINMSNPECDLGTEPLCADTITGTSNKASCSVEYDKCHAWSCTVHQFDLTVNCMLVQDCVLSEPSGVKTCSPTCHAEVYKKCQQTHACGTHRTIDSCKTDPLFIHCDNTLEICELILADSPTDEGSKGIATWVIVALAISGSTFLVLIAVVFVIVRSWNRSHVKTISVDKDEKTTSVISDKIPTPTTSPEHGTQQNEVLGIGSTKPLIQTVDSIVESTTSIVMTESIPIPVDKSYPSVHSVAPSKVSINIASTITSVPPPQPEGGIPVMGSILESVVSNPFEGSMLESVTSSIPPQSSQNCSSRQSKFDLGDLNSNMLSKWHKADLVGKGSFGEVYLGILTSGYFVAVKVVDLGKNLETSEVANLLKEVQLMKTFKHKNITQYLDAGFDPELLKLNIFMEFVDGGSLSTLVKKLPTQLDDTLAARYTKQILEGLKYLHEECHTIHRDIKGENVLVRNDGVVKLADFGCSKQMQSVAMKTRGCETMVGTPYWMAPEVISVKEGQVYGFASDVWSVGCTVSEMLNRGEPPWPIFPSMWAAIFNIGGAEGLPTNLPKKCSPLSHSFMVACLVKDPKQRPIVSTLLSHEWVASINVTATGLPAPGSLFATEGSHPNAVTDSLRTADSN